MKIQNKSICALYMQIVLQSLFICSIICQFFPQLALADIVNAISVRANFDAKAVISLPPPSPITFNDLAETSFYSFAMAAGNSNSGRELILYFYFWKTSSQSVSARVYVDGPDYMSGPTAPVLIGRKTLMFTKSGVRDMSSASYVQDSHEYILDRDPPPLADGWDVEVSLPWRNKPVEKISIKFDSVSLTDSASFAESVISHEIATDSGYR